MFDSLKCFFNNFRQKSEKQDSITGQRKIKQKNLDEVEVALQRTFINRRTSQGSWMIFGGKVRNENDNLHVTYKFTPNNSEVPILSLTFIAAMHTTDTLLSWSLEVINSEHKDSAADLLIRQVILDTNMTIEELVTSAN